MVKSIRFARTTGDLTHAATRTTAIFADRRPPATAISGQSPLTDAPIQATSRACPRPNRHMISAIQVVLNKLGNIVNRPNPSVQSVSRLVAACALSATILGGCTAIESVQKVLLTPYASEMPAFGEYRDRVYFACCNLHQQRGIISDANFTSTEMIPVGSPVKILAFESDGRNFAWVEIGGQRYRLLHEYGVRKGETFEQFLEKTLLKDSPDRRIAGLPPAVRETVRAGRVARGMTHEQVILALGYPPATATPNLGHSVWRYWFGRFDEYDVVFDEIGRVTDVAALVNIRSQVVATTVR